MTDNCLYYTIRLARIGENKIEVVWGVDEGGVNGSGIDGVVRRGEGASNSDLDDIIMSVNKTVLDLLHHTLKENNMTDSLVLEYM